MRDLLEQQLATRLRELGDAVPDELPVPADLHAEVHRRRRRRQRARRWAGFAVAAALVAAVALVATLVATGTPRSVTVAPANPPPVVADPLPAGTVMLSAKGPDVVARDATGRIIATMVHKTKGEIVDVQVTADHKTIWYRTRSSVTGACDTVARADITGRSSEFIARAMTFSISPDGTQLALAGNGQLETGLCNPPPGGHGNSEVIVRNLRTGAVAKGSVQDLASLQWSRDGSYLAVTRCVKRCARFERARVEGKRVVFGVGQRGGARVVPLPSARVVFGPNSAFAVTTVDSSDYGATTLLDEYDVPSLTFTRTRGSVRRPRVLVQVIPSLGDPFVVARTGDGPPALYRVVRGKLELVRAIDPGVSTPVFPIAH